MGDWEEKALWPKTQVTVAGAFPEVRQPQFPLGMGKGEDRSTGTLAATVGSNGQVNYDAILKQSKLSERNVTSDHGALIPKLDAINKNVGSPLST